MPDFEDIVSAVQQRPKEKLVLLMQECSLVLTGVSATEPHSHQDIAPLDVPIEDHKDEKTGSLRIRFPYTLGAHISLGWRELVVTPAAQRTLLGIFAQSVIKDEKAGRIPPTLGNLQ